MSYKMAKVYLGDVGVITLVERVKPQLPENIDFSVMTLRELCNFALSIGVDLKEIIGVNKCSGHAGMVVLGNNKMPDGYNLFEHCIFCKNCWQLFRLKRL